jgi:hypothetical protein
MCGKEFFLGGRAVYGGCGIWGMWWRWERKWRVVLPSVERLHVAMMGLDYRLGGTLIGGLTLRCSNTHFLSVLIYGGGGREL